MVSERGGAVDIVGVSHGFDTGSILSVLDDVTISARPGEFVALLGPSGSGKSTLLRLVAGLDRPLVGEVYLDGAPIRGPHWTRGLVFQDPTLLPWRTVRQNVGLGPQARGRGAVDVDKIDAALELVGLADFGGVLPAQLSGGMAQRAALARALVNEPRVLLFDEPLGRLDSLTRRDLQGELLRLWRDRGFTALLVTHDVDEAIVLADRIVLLSPRPARVLEEVSVDFDRPRDPTDPRFVELRRAIFDVIDNSAVER
ncbi:ABC transporter ATP-binding protein [Gordonia soli]|uniref:Putative ABC transporter ATP-binding protein n=1 Tax=Gordonia soli NBRC 108243 TaxID=1223545 RepID=M0QH29_9ACTN|nr:ABC transporter ATP-binding protein [Gordonia soli]GAC66732.1 putative ABC transporter ATP-binding protein [Gordonia soli NBRC 108243]